MKKLSYMTPTFHRLYRLAKENNLTCPMGRAVAQTSRHQNDGYSGFPDSEEVVLMKRFRLSTVKRWLAHVKSGGSIKALRYTHEEWLAKRRKNDRECRARWRGIKAEWS